MELFLVSFGVLMLAVGGMAIGVMCGRTPIAGSCGGLNNRDGSACQTCSRPCNSRRGASTQNGAK